VCVCVCVCVCVDGSSKEQDMNKNNSVHGWAVEVNKAGSLSIVTNLRRRKKSR
jgi:hypothetical protein